MRAGEEKKKKPFVSCRRCLFKFGEFRSLSLHLFWIGVHLAGPAHRSQHTVVCSLTVPIAQCSSSFCVFFLSHVSSRVLFVHRGHFLLHKTYCRFQWQFEDTGERVRARVHTTHHADPIGLKVHDEWETKAWTRSQPKRLVCRIISKNC